MLSVGDDLISIAVADPKAAQTLAAAIRDLGEFIDVVPGIDSVVLHYDNAAMTRSVAEQKMQIAVARVSGPDFTESAEVTPIEIPIAYGGEFGPDFDFVCEKLRLSRQEFIALHSGEYTVDMLGFMPGFAYIGGLDKRLNIDRLRDPRQNVPAGSVGIAGGRTGLYALPGPGGWPLIGRTACRLFDASADEPFTLQAGSKVLFTAVDSL